MVCFGRGPSLRASIKVSLPYEYIRRNLYDVCKSLVELLERFIWDLGRGADRSRSCDCFPFDRTSLPHYSHVRGGGDGGELFPRRSCQLPLSHLPHRNQYDRRSLEVKKSNLSIQVASKYIFWQEQLMHERILS